MTDITNTGNSDAAVIDTKDKRLEDRRTKKLDSSYDGTKRRSEDFLADRLVRLETNVGELQKDLDNLNREVRTVNDKINEQNIKMTVNFSQVNETMTIMRLSAESLKQTIDDIKAAMIDIKQKQEHFTTIDAMSKGSWKMLAVIGTALGAASTVLAWAFQHLKIL